MWTENFEILKVRLEKLYKLLRAMQCPEEERNLLLEFVINVYCAGYNDGRAERG